jgi:predicted amidohydrolase
MARYVTVGTVSHHPPSTDFDALHNQAAAYLERAVRLGAQIVAFPEVYPQAADYSPARELAQPLDGPSLTFISQEARRHGVHVIWPLYTQEEGRTYNSAVLLGPDGGTIGIYHKMFPTLLEMEGGVTPGAGPGVFDTDLGRIGMVICFDLNFPEIMEGTAAAGAEIIFFCSAYRGGLQTQSWAYLLNVYVVSAVLAELGVVVDVSGRVLAESTYETVLTHRLNLDRKLMHMDANWRKMDAMLAKYGPKLSIDFFTREGCWAVGSESDEFTIDDIMAEFQLEPREAYFNRSRRRREEALGGA